LKEECVGPISGIDAVEMRKIPWACQVLNSGFISCPARILVPIQTELPRFFINVRITTKGKLWKLSSVCLPVFLDLSCRRLQHTTGRNIPILRLVLSHNFNKVDVCPLCVKSFNNSNKSSRFSRLSVMLQNNNVYETFPSRLFSKNLVAFYWNQEVTAGWECNSPLLRFLNCKVCLAIWKKNRRRVET
jgi:hypothetical protein